MKIALFLHLIGASVWVGGHLYLLLRLMPNFVKRQQVREFLAFEKSYEPLGMAALLLQVITGVYMLHRIVPLSLWFAPMGYVSALIYAKIGFLLLTLLTAMFARFFVVAKLEKGTHTPRTMAVMWACVALICLWSLGFVATGVAFRG